MDMALTITITAVISSASYFIYYRLQLINRIIDLEAQNIELRRTLAEGHLRDKISSMSLDELVKSRNSR